MKAMNSIKTTLVVLGLLTLGSTQFANAKPNVSIDAEGCISVTVQMCLDTE